MSFELKDEESVAQSCGGGVKGEHKGPTGEKEALNNSDP